MAIQHVDPDAMAVLAQFADMKPRERRDWHVHHRLTPRPAMRSITRSLMRGILPSQRADWLRSRRKSLVISAK